MAVTDDPLRLAELLCARLCHDLSGLLGSLCGVLELSAEDAADSEALALASTTAKEVALRLKLLRAAWGGDAGPIDLALLRGLGEGLSPGRVTLDLSRLPPGVVFSPQVGRAVLNLLLLATEALPGGGVVALAGTGASDVTITVGGPRAAWPARLAACMADPDVAWTAMTGPREMQVPLAVLLAAVAGVRLSLQPSGTPDTPEVLRLSDT